MLTHPTDDPQPYLPKMFLTTNKTKASFDPYSAVYQRLIDGVIASGAFWLAYQAQFDGRVPAAMAVQLWGLLFGVVLGRVGTNELFRCYRTIWRYFGLRDLATLACSCAVFSFALCSLRWVHFAPVLRIPVGIVLTELLLSFTGMCGARLARRLLYEAAGAQNGSSDEISVLLIGAGRAGVNVANQLRACGRLRPIGFLDDDPKKIGLFVAGLKVYGPISALDVIAGRNRVQQVIVCVAAPPREKLRRIWATCDLLGIAVKVLPPIEEIFKKKTNIANFKNIDMNDLLGRLPAEQSGDHRALLQAYQGKRILITGAGGSIGSELAVQLSKLAPAGLLLLDKDENGLNDTYVRVQNAVQTSPVVADLRFSERIRSVLETFRPEVVFHAAAHKHVHLMETNPCEAITNNVTGTRNLIEQSVALGVSLFVQISTDKAVSPTSVMGASKTICEMMVQSYGRRTGGLFCCVRFGNVLGSRGSVVPIFQEQILRGGPVTVTHPDAKRFLMTIPEAVCLLIQAGTLANNRDIFVLDMGEPVMIGKLAEDLIELSGLSPNRDIRIEITGLKRGEKLSEVLMERTSELRDTTVEKIKAIGPRALEVAPFTACLDALERAAWNGNAEEVYRQLRAINIGYDSQTLPRPWPLTSPAVAPVPRVGGTVASEMS